MTLLIRLLGLICFFSATANAGELPPLPGERHDIGGHQLHINCMGQGSPTIIIDTGLGDDSSDWQLILEQSAQISKTCVYDRSGYGWSDYGPRPRNSRRIAYELDLLLQQANIPAPYILVGHSFGGYNMRVFAATHPQKISGLILVDASHENQYERLDINIPKSGRRIRSIISLPSTTIKEFPPTKKNQLLQDRAFRTARHEISSLYQSSRQVQRFGDIPTVPLIVISRGIEEWSGNDIARQREKTWIRLQQDLTFLSPISQHIFAHHSGHNIHQQQPEIIVDAISEVTHLARVISSP